MMIEFAISVLLVALLSAFIVIVLTKWKIREYIQVHGGNFFGKMADCDFCFGFWIAVLLSVGAAIAVGDCSFLFVPLFSAPITRYIL